MSALGGSTVQCHARARGIVAADLDLMRHIDALYLQWSFYGSRRLCDELQQRGQRVNRKRVQRLMQQMGFQALYPKPRTSQLGKCTRSIPIYSGA